MSVPSAALLAAMGAALVSVIALRIARGVPMPWVGARATLRSAFGTFVVGFSLAALAIPAASLLGWPTDAAERLGALVGFSGATLLGVLIAMHRRDERTALRLIEILPSAHAPAHVHRALVERLADLDARCTGSEARRVRALEVAAVRAMRLSGLREPSLRLAESLANTELPEPLRDALLYDRALLRLRDGDYEGAVPLLDDAHAGPRLSLRAFAHALQGGADQALELLDRALPVEPEPRLIAGVARGHALAAMGRDDETRQVLQALVEEHGVSAFTHLLRPVGPATEHARALLGRTSEPPDPRPDD